MSDSYSADKEKGSIDDHVVTEAAPDDAVIADRFARYGKLGPIMQRLFASGVEARGVERVPEDQRETKNVWNKCVPCYATRNTISLNVNCVAS